MSAFSTTVPLKAQGSLYYTSSTPFSPRWAGGESILSCFEATCPNMKSFSCLLANSVTHFPFTASISDFRLHSTRERAGPHGLSFMRVYSTNPKSKKSMMKPYPKEAKLYRSKG